ncbi:HAD hydrolase subfamily IA REG-2 [Pyrrhoderma noxium]|uniref:HAD hydrolase subfamily IA REG-2 n=1 Tax=Pyrrhoderma noxium TaxID=2282107 RepID=A0A286UGE5_9AGAM|nr:HAD hydrolase subfamily IA REG-2 [Pyrrhoderma noxium]
MVGISSQPRISLVTFDALFTLLKPRAPLHVQYADVFRPSLGSLNPDDIKSSFKQALKNAQQQQPAYRDGHEDFWSLVIRQTAIGAGANPSDVSKHMDSIVPRLLKRFSSREGYALYDDVLPTLKALNEMGVKTALVSNADSRILSALDDLEALHYLRPALASDIEGIEKPQREIFLRACSRANCSPEETLHVGDELESDYFGASNAGLRALLLRRPGEETRDEDDLEMQRRQSVRRIETLEDVVRFVEDS